MHARTSRHYCKVQRQVHPSTISTFPFTKNKFIISFRTSSNKPTAQHQCDPLPHWPPMSLNFLATPHLSPLHDKKQHLFQLRDNNRSGEVWLQKRIMSLEPQPDATPYSCSSLRYNFKTKAKLHACACKVSLINAIAPPIIKYTS